MCPPEQDLLLSDLAKFLSASPSQLKQLVRCSRPCVSRMLNRWETRRHRLSHWCDHMNRLPLSLLLLAALSAGSRLATVPARAQHMNEKDSPCANTAVNEDLTECLSKAKDSSDAKLNSVYKNLRDKLDSSDAEHLMATERLWIQYRDANCSAERELYGGGTASFPAYLACIEAMTRARTKELEVTYAVKLK
jgi:uncharacterized protein YecT (DUF1311 family)